MKPLIIGEDTGNIDYGTGHALGHGAWRYYGAMATDEAEFWKMFDTVNLFDDRKQKWSTEKVDEQVRRLVEREWPWRSVILYASKRVARAFEGRSMEYFEIAPGYPVRTCIPHPSGRNRFWNDSDQIHNLGSFLWTMDWLADYFLTPERTAALDSGANRGVVLTQAERELGKR